MSPPPARPKIYHITPVDNLPSIVGNNALYSDALMISRGGPSVAIGMSEIKRRRLTLRVRCHPGTNVGDYVPFFYCPRSFMLYLLWKANHPDVSYRGGQDGIVHLELDLMSVVSWAVANGAPWAISFSNAGSRYARHSNDITSLSDLDWDSIENHNFSSPEIKENKQAEFLCHTSVAWPLVERVGVLNRGTENLAYKAIESSAHHPTVARIPA